MIPTLFSVFFQLLPYLLPPSTSVNDHIQKHQRKHLWTHTLWGVCNKGHNGSFWTEPRKDDDEGHGDPRVWEMCMFAALHAITKPYWALWDHSQILIEDLSTPVYLTDYNNIPSADYFHFFYYTSSRQVKLSDFHINFTFISFKYLQLMFLAWEAHWNSFPIFVQQWNVRKGRASNVIPQSLTLL